MTVTPDFVRRRLEEIDSRGLLRRPPVIDYVDPVHGRVEGRDVVLFCSNDYLGLRTDPRVTRAAADAAERWGGGAGSSRMIAGSLPIHRQLEDGVAEWLGTEAALVFPTGYQANLALLQGLATEHDLLVSDALNHASLIDGCRASSAHREVVAHGDVDAIRTALSAPGFEQRFVVGEGIYSMDGDRGPVAAWVEAAGQRGAHVIVDEAHALGVAGPAGRGVCAEASTDPLARVGTFGKALGAAGGAIATDSSTRELLLNTGRTYIFTTGLAPAAAGAALAGIAIARSDDGDERRSRLTAHARRVRHALRDAGHEVLGDEDVPIVPLVIGTPAATLARYRRLFDAGVYAMAIRPPTVPEGTCRIRVTLSAEHSDDDIDRLLGALTGPPGGGR